MGAMAWQGQSAPQLFRATLAISGLRRMAKRRRPASAAHAAS
jgi:hypothetical protein